MSKQSAIELRRQLTLQKVDPEVYERVINFIIHLRGDLMEKHNDATLIFTVRKTLTIYLPKADKVVDRIMQFMLPARYKLK